MICGLATARAWRRGLVAGVVSVPVMMVGAARAGEVQPAALTIQGYPGGHGVVHDPADRQWYVLPGAELAEVEVDTIKRSTDCPTSQPLVSIYNPEGHWMQRVDQVGGLYIVGSPALAGRYLLKVSITDPACSGLGYRIDLLLTPATEIHSKSAAVQLCDDATAQLRRYTALLRRHVSAGARRRYAAVRRRARADVRADCGRNA